MQTFYLIEKLFGGAYTSIGIKNENCHQNTPNVFAYLQQY